MHSTQIHRTRMYRGHKKGEGLHSFCMPKYTVLSTFRTDVTPPAQHKVKTPSPSHVRTSSQAFQTSRAPPSVQRPTHPHGGVLQRRAAAPLPLSLPLPLPSSSSPFRASARRSCGKTLECSGEGLGYCMIHLRRRDRNTRVRTGKGQVGRGGRTIHRIHRVSWLRALPEGRETALKPKIWTHH